MGVVCVQQAENSAVKMCKLSRSVDETPSDVTWTARSDAWWADKKLPGCTCVFWMYYKMRYSKLNAHMNG